MIATLAEGQAIILYSPVMETMLTWCNDYLTGEEAEENGGLGRAARYFVKHYKGLSAFCRIEGALIDNNTMEGHLKLIAPGEAHSSGRRLQKRHNPSL